MKIAIDGMGGDKAPAIVVEGAVLAAKEFGYEIIIVGSEVLIEEELSRHRPRPQNISIIHASEVIEMDEPPAISVRRKKDSSITVGTNLVKEKRADAFVSAGNTGAVACATTLLWGLIEGIDRPGIAIIFPNLKDTGIIIDVGANIDAKPQHLLQYAIMGDVCSRYMLKKQTPKIGLLNIGEEESKGPEFVKETHRLLNESKLSFIGNVEGKDVFNGKADVTICDGFVGNIVLKISESVAETVAEFLKRAFRKNLMSKLAALMSLPALNSLKKDIDYSEYGGAPLLGVNGICIICHGRSSAKAIKNAIRVAAEFVKLNINQHILEAVKTHM